jgi:hypothetical protein
MYIVSLLVSFTAAILGLLVREDMYVFVSYAAVIPLLLSLPRIVYRMGYTTPAWLRYTELLGFLIVTTNAPGTIFFHEDLPGWQYDRLIHFVIGALVLPLGVCALIGLGKAKDFVKTVRKVTIIMFFGLFLWEGHQWVNDKIFGTHMFYDYAQPLGQDFAEDIVFGAFGLMLSVRYMRGSMSRFNTFYVPQRS